MTKEEYAIFGEDYLNMSLRDALKCVIWHQTRQGEDFQDRVKALAVADEPWMEVPPRWWKDWKEAPDA